jgi:hypothetical protein
MAYDEFKFSFVDDPTLQSSICAACGNTAEIQLALLGGVSHHSASFCFACGEEVIHDLRQQRVEQATGVRVHAAHQSFLRVDSTRDENEHGTIFWEGHGWSSDGPFAGA